MRTNNALGDQRLPQFLPDPGAGFVHGREFGSFLRDLPQILDEIRALAAALPVSALIRAPLSAVDQLRQLIFELFAAQHKTLPAGQVLRVSLFCLPGSLVFQNLP